MISNERHWPSRPNRPRPPQPYYDRPERPVPPKLPENTLGTLEFQVERKRFLLLLKENPRGRFLRIIEESATKSNMIIIPSAGLKDFRRLFEEMVEANLRIPPGKNQPPAVSGADSSG